MEVKLLGSEEFGALIKNEIEEWTEVVKAANLIPE